MSKLILVIGATGAQGIAVIDSLLEPAKDGSPSPYRARALTRDPESRRAKLLAEKGVEIVKGGFDDLSTVERAMQGVYGVWNNVDGFTVGEHKEIFLGMRIFELAKSVGTIKHYVWSNLDYATKKGNYNAAYRCEHYDAKGRVAEWMSSQPSESAGMTWSIVTTGPYMDMLFNIVFGPLNVRKDGTYVFATPVGHGHVPMIALSDVGFWARHTFDHREETSGRDLEVASDVVGWDDLAATFTKVTGKRAVVLRQSPDEWFANFNGVDDPVAAEKQGQAWTSYKQNFAGWWALYRDDIAQRDMDWIRSVHPETRSLERWMREVKYTGELHVNVLKITEDGNTISPNFARFAEL